MEQKLIIREEWIKLENQLGRELMETSPNDRTVKYTQVYEKAYSALSFQKKRQMSANYLKAAIVHSEILKKIIGTDKSVLDIGSGFGHLSSILAKQGNHVVGIDVNRIHISEAKELHGHIKNLQFIQTTGRKLNFLPDIFDFVISTSVFEHLHPDDVNEHLSEVKKVLRKGGKYIFTAITPYSRGDASRFSEDPKEREQTGFHINLPTWRKLEGILEANGYKGKTNILPVRLVNRIPHFSFLIPIAFKSSLENKVKINQFTVRIFKLGDIFVVAKPF